MGLVHYEPQIEDDFSAEVIRLARERSDDIDDWFNARSWMNEVTEDEVTPLWLRKRCLTLVLDELEEWGIVLNIDVNTAFSDPQLVYCLLMLLKKFSDEDLKQLFKTHPECMNVARSEMGPDLLDAIVNWCDTYLPLDDGWTLIANTFKEYIGVIGGDNEKFLNHVNTIIEAVDALGDPDISYFVDEDLYVKFIGLMVKRVGFIRKFCDMWINRAETDYARMSRQYMIDQYLIGGFEKELASKDEFVKFSADFEQLDVADNVKVIEFFNKIRKPLLKRWMHALEYYAGKEKIACPDMMLTVIIATLVVDCPNQLALIATVRAKFDEYLDIFGTESVQQLKEAFDDLTSNMVNQVEVNYAAD